MSMGKVVMVIVVVAIITAFVGKYLAMVAEGVK
jgi:hypothetical protein